MKNTQADLKTSFSTCPTEDEMSNEFPGPARIFCVSMLERKLWPPLAKLYIM